MLLTLAAAALHLTHPLALLADPAPQLADQRLTLADGAELALRRPAIQRSAPPRPAATWPALERRFGVAGALWDPERGAPIRLWGAGIAVPGAIDHPQRAADFARALLRDHLDVLAPGADLDDFFQVSDTLSGGVRSVGFAQRRRGRPVLGGQISFRFKKDRLVMIAAEALPVVDLELSDAPIAASRAAASARTWLLGQRYQNIDVTAVDGPMILSTLQRGQRRSREVYRVEVAAERPFARAWVYVDAAAGDVLALESKLRAASATIHVEVPVRYPGGGRHQIPLAGAALTLDGEPTATDDQGAVEIGDQSVTGQPALTGQLVRVVNSAGDDATVELKLSPGETALWSGADELLLESQLTNYTAVYAAKRRVRQIAPDFTWLDGQIKVTTNMKSGACNAYSDGQDLFFLQGAEDQCEHTARLVDVSYHELGHSVHTQAIIPGVGAFDGALSEGISDYLAATITGDPKMAPGFFLTPEPLRDLDPQGKEWHWPEDRGQIHDEGRIIGGTLWDLRVALVAKLGEEAGVAATDTIWFESIRRAIDIPTMYPEALLTDDDDGDLSNGTPNSCEIDLAFHAHGLVGASAFAPSVTLSPMAGDGSQPVTLNIDVDAKQPCLGLTVDSAVLEWRPRGANSSESIAMTSVAAGFTAALPQQPDGAVLEYRIKATLSDGITFSFPDNPADPWYQRYYGPVVPIYCTGFEGDAQREGWQLFNDWQFGASAGRGGDPLTSHEGASVAGTDLGQGEEDGLYAPMRTSRARSPVIDVAAAAAGKTFQSVRLQYWRWLTVEDAEFDRAVIAINEKNAWVNATAGLAPELNNLHHLDREWRFHDLDITPGIVDGKVQLSFVITGDGAIDFGGWNLDSLCVVGVAAAPAPACGDGAVDPGESCDDGNQAPGDGCDANCQLEGGESDTTETTAAATDTSTDTDSATGGQLDDEGCGCALPARDKDPARAPLSALAALLLLAIARRRR
jgi:cysteine-rich repeat protein